MRKMNISTSKSSTGLKFGMVIKSPKLYPNIYFLCDYLIKYAN